MCRMQGRTWITYIFAHEDLAGSESLLGGPSFPPRSALSLSEAWPIWVLGSVSRVTFGTRAGQHKLCSWGCAARALEDRGRRRAPHAPQLVGSSFPGPLGRKWGGFMKVSSSAHAAQQNIPTGSAFGPTLGASHTSGRSAAVLMLPRASWQVPPLLFAQRGGGWCADPSPACLPPAGRLQPTGLSSRLPVGASTPPPAPGSPMRRVCSSSVLRT